MTLHVDCSPVTLVMLCVTVIVVVVIKQIMRGSQGRMVSFRAKDNR